jgi:hypothetical protein
MSDNTPDKVNDLLEAAINNSTRAWDAQSKYFDDFIKRNVAAFATLSDARIESLKEIGESQSFNQAFEANIAYEQTVRDEFRKMREDNERAWIDLEKRLSAIYVATDNGEESAHK